MGKFRSLPFVSCFLLSFILSFGFTGSSDATKGSIMANMEDCSLDATASMEGQVFFTENLGQWPMDVSLLAEVGFGHIGLSDAGLLFDLSGPGGRGNILRYDLVGAYGNGWRGYDALEHRTNYFYGNDSSRWIFGVKSYRGAIYRDAWTGIDVQFLLGDNGAKYEFHVAPFADPEEISIRVSGHREILTHGSELSIILENGMVFRESDLIAFYQDEEAERVDVHFRSDDGERISFELGDYDNSRAIVIDPLLMNSTYIGTSGSEGDGKVTMDEDGSIYVAGSCAYSNFPTTPGAYDITWNQYYDTVVFKMDADLSGLVYSTYYGGKWADIPSDIAYAGNGEVIVAGTTNSDDLPTTAGAYQRELNHSMLRSYDLFILHLNRTGGCLLGSTYLGWEGSEIGPCLSLGLDGCPILSSGTPSKDVPTSLDSYDDSYNGGSTDTVLVRMDRNLSSMLYSSYMGGSGGDDVLDIGIGPSGLVFLAGSTSSVDFPTTMGSYETRFNTSLQKSGWTACINITSGDLVFSSFINSFLPKALALSGHGDLVIGGISNSSSFRTLPGAYQRAPRGDYDAAVIVMYGNGSDIISSTFLGGTGKDALLDVDLNSTDHVFLTGVTEAGFPVTPGAYSTTGFGLQDCFVSVLGPDLSDLIYSTFIGGTKWDYPCSIMVESGDIAYISGNSASNNYPTTFGSYSQLSKGSTEIFVTKMRCPKVYLPPMPPRNLTGEVFDDHVELGWEEPIWDGDTEVIGYNISRSSQAWTFEVVGRTCNLSFNDTSIDINLTYDYFVTAYNRIGDSVQTRNLTLWEMTPPSINEDLTPSVRHPGEDLVFALDVTDNSRISEVVVVYWREGGEEKRAQMIPSFGDIYTNTTELRDEEYSIHYYFEARDIKDNMVRTNETEVKVQGKYLPTFMEDLTPRTVMTLGPINFCIRVWDNWELPIVHLEFWTGDGHHRNVTMDRYENDTFSFITRATGYPGEMMYYVFRAVDLHGNWNRSILGTVLILESPHMDRISDLTSDRATTGDRLNFSVLIHDAVNVDDVEVSFRFGDGPLVVERMEGSIEGIWKRSIIVPDVLDDIQYRFNVSDPSGKVSTTPWSSIHVEDNDPPEIGDFIADEFAIDGEVLSFSISASDNIAVDEAMADIWFEGGHFKETALIGDGVYGGSILVPVDAMGPLDVIVRVVDTSGNERVAGPVSIDVLDLIAPVVKVGDGIVTYAGREVAVELDVDDNIGVGSVIWKGLPESFEGTTWNGIFDEPGTYRIEILAKDMSGNTGAGSFVIVVHPRDQDSDKDGLPDLFEMEMGLDHLSGLDASLDMDGDGLTNLMEYQLGTGLDLKDTDSDGMDDGWEVLFGLDPDRFSAYEDLDGDDRTDLEEYLEGSDPTKANEGPRETGLDMFALKMVSIALLMSLSMAVLLYILISRKGPERTH